MKSFIKKISIFSCPLILVPLIFYLVINNAEKKAIRDYRFNPEVKALIMGDSHIAQGINDSLIDASKNIASDGESLFYTYYKLINLTKGNPYIKKIYLGVNYHSFSNYYDEHTYKNCKDFFFIIPLNQQFKILRNNPEPILFFLESITSEAKSLFQNPKNRNWLGAYHKFYSDQEVNQKSIKNRINSQYYFYSDLRDFSDLNIQYFSKIIEYCKSNRISLCILKTPLYKDYRNSVPEKFISKYNSLIKDNNLNIIDLNNLEAVLDKSNYLPDGDHLSVSGATLASNYLCKVFIHN